MTGSSLAVTAAGSVSRVLRLQYSGSNVVDGNGDQLRFKDISVGNSVPDVIDGSGRSTHQALFGNAGDDVITGGSGHDLIVGGTGNDILSSGCFWCCKAMLRGGVTDTGGKVFLH